ncbi:MAG TPA: hypothetical protein VGR78_17130 [Verrucomicrobiae bacterium]|nr:hypothetical protein [Verrucomicrobiae bacterium]
MSSAGKLYGTFIVEEALADGSETVFLVRHRTDATASGGVLKTVVLPKSDSLQPGVMAARRLDAIALQDRVASDWPEVAPVLDRPTTREQLRDVLSAGEAWFVTPRYETSLQALLARQNGSPLSGTAVWLICRTVARGALAFAQVDPGTGRRSHGNLKLSNILIQGLPVRENGSEIVVSDPAPGGRSDQTPAEREQLQRDFEKDDLEALGRILLQLLAGRPLPESTNWIAAWEGAVGEPRRWKKIFGPGARQWRNLCRELLDVRTSAGSLSLASLERRLGEMHPREPAANPQMIGFAAGVIVVLAGILFLILHRSSSAELAVDVPLPSVDIFISPANDPGKKVKLSPSDNQASRFSIRRSPGTYQVDIVPNGEFNHLSPVSTNVVLNTRENRILSVPFEYAKVQLTSTPAGSEVQWRSANKQETLGHTPLTVILPPDGRYEESEFQFLANGYTRKTLHTQLASGTNLTLAAMLTKQQLGSITAEFRSAIDQGAFRRTRFYVDDAEKTSEIVELTPNEQYPLTIAPPEPWHEVLTNINFGPEPPHHIFVYSPPAGTLLLTYQDADIRTAAVWLHDDKNGDLKLGTVANEVFRLPPGRYTLTLELDGYLPSSFPVGIINGKTNIVPAHLERATR